MKHADRYLENTGIESKVDPGFCPAGEDGIHCVHWWDGDGCCLCDALPMAEKEKREQGMISKISKG